MSDQAPLVSVLMTAYNREKYIGEAIGSVLASSYRNFELIIVDDRSSDRTVEIANGFAAKDPRVKVYINEKNLGDYPNRNKAASHAQGVYLKYVDADDYIYPWALEMLVNMMEKFPAAGWGLCSMAPYIKSPFPFMLTPREAYEYNYLGPGLFHKAPLSSIIRKQIFDDAGGFSSQRMCGDYEMWHRLALKYNVVLMPQGMVWYREHGDQEVRDYAKFHQAYESIVVRYLSAEDCPLDKKKAADLLKKRKSGLLGKVMRGALKLNAAEVNTNWKCFKLYHAR